MGPWVVACFLALYSTGVNGHDGTLEPHLQQPANHGPIARAHATSPPRTQATPHTIQYTLDPNFPKDNTSWASSDFRPTAVAVGLGADGATEVHMVLWGGTEPPITTFDTDGNVLRRWGSPHIIKATGLRAQNGPRNTSFLWVTDMGDYTVKKFNVQTGELVLTLGEAGHAGTSTAPLQFGNVSDIAFADGAIFISDGDCLCTDGGMNHRVLRISTRTLAVEWSTGNDGTFQNPHALDVYQDTVFVADREHNRTVVLDARTGAVRTSYQLQALGPASHPPSVNGLRVDAKAGVLVMGLLPAPIHSDGGLFQMAAWDLAALPSTGLDTLTLPPPAYRFVLPIRGLHEMAMDEATGDVYLALFEAGQFARMRKDKLLSQPGQDDAGDLDLQSGLLVNLLELEQDQLPSEQSNPPQAHTLIQLRRAMDHPHVPMLLYVALIGGVALGLTLMAYQANKEKRRGTYSDLGMVTNYGNDSMDHEMVSFDGELHSVTQMM